MTSCKPPARRCRRPTALGQREQARPPEPQRPPRALRRIYLLQTGTDPGFDPGRDPGEPRSPSAPSSPAPRHCGRFSSSPKRASTPRSLRRSTLRSGFREWGPGGAGRRRSRGAAPLTAPQREATRPAREIGRRLPALLCGQSRRQRTPSESRRQPAPTPPRLGPRPGASPGSPSGWRRA